MSQETAAQNENTKYYTTKSVEGTWDTVIIGSGISGLTCAAVLAGAGQKVLVLEQHYVPGGFTHTFHRGNFEWDVGVHYFGKARNSSQWFYQLSALTGGRIEFEPFGDIIETLVFPGLKIQVPNGYDRYAETLGKLFPAEKKGIRDYLALIDEARKSLRIFFGVNLLPGSLTVAARATFARKIHQLSLTTTDQVMARYLKDEHLKSILDVQWGNIGMPRARCSFIIHAAMLGNFLEEGAGYPKGGAGVFAHELGRTIYENGGAVRVHAGVDIVLTRNGKAFGVRLENGEEILSQRVISTVGAVNTVERLLREEPGIDSYRAVIKGLPTSFEFINLFMGLKDDPRKAGLGNGNQWITRTWDSFTEENAWDISDLKNNPHPEYMFFSSASIHDPKRASSKYSGYNGQVIAVAKQKFFDKWKDSRWGQRGEDYDKVKQDVSDALIGMMDEYSPGFRGLVEKTEVGTPLTYVKFGRQKQGAPYGIASTPDRYRTTVLRPMTPVKNFYMCGQDLIMPGVPAAFGSAILTCSLILRGNIGGPLTKKGKKIVEKAG